MSAEPRVSVLLLSWNGRHHLEACLAALAAQQAPGIAWEILVLDNGSSDGTSEWLRRVHPEVRLLESPVNLGFCRGYERLVAAARGEWVALLNNDTRPQPQWLGSAVEALGSAPADVAGVAGMIVDWEGDRLDFGRGIVAFDGHALQLDFRRPLARARIPASGEEVLVACGGNCLLRKRSFLAAGGFDPRYFAYLEDVDLSWRLWSGGERLIFSREATVHHRSAATSDLLGSHRRGFLFERNALRTVYKNLEPELWSALMPAILFTLAARLEALIATSNPGGAALRVDPFPDLAATPAPPVAERESLGEKWRRHGTVELARRGARKAARQLRASGSRPAAEHIDLEDPRTFEHLRALSVFLAGIDEVEAARRVVQARRRRADRDLFTRFPLWIVPTYPGDERWLTGETFATWLPRELRFERARLDEVMELK